MSGKHKSFLCGLHNIGNTCYMNSVLQILLHNQQLQQHLEDREFKNGLLGNIMKKMPIIGKNINDKDAVGNAIIMTLTCQLYKLLQHMQHTSILSPQAFKMLLGIKNETFRGCSQNDSHELLSYLLDTIHEETKCDVELRIQSFPNAFHIINNERAKCTAYMNSAVDENTKREIIGTFRNFENSHRREVVIHSGVTYWASYIKNNFSVVSQYFTGIYCSSIRCSECQNVSYSFEIFTSVSLEVPEKGDISIFDCLTAFTACEILSDGYQCAKCNKKTIGNKSITFWNLPEILIINFKRFKTNIIGRARPQKICTDIKYPQTLDLSAYMCEYNKRPAIYDLSAVVYHHGQFGGGHYTSCCTVGKFGWFLFNDGHVSKICDTERDNMSDASYILVFNMRH